MFLSFCFLIPTWRWIILPRRVVLGFNEIVISFCLSAHFPLPPEADERTVMNSTGTGPAHRLLTALGEAVVQDGPEDSLRGGPCPTGSLLRPHTRPVHLEGEHLAP